MERTNEGYFSQCWCHLVAEKVKVYSKLFQRLPVATHCKYGIYCWTYCGSKRKHLSYFSPLLFSSFLMFCTPLCISILPYRHNRLVLVSMTITSINLIRRVLPSLFFFHLCRLKLKCALSSLLDMSDLTLFRISWSPNLSSVDLTSISCVWARPVSGSLL